MATVSQIRSRNRGRSDNRREGPALLDDMLNMAGSLANSRKEYAAAQLESLAESVRQFTDVMPEIPTMKAYAETAAESLDELAAYVTESDLSEMVADVKDFTRRHPLATLGGSIAAGLIITQLVQARTAPSFGSASHAARSRQTGRRQRRSSGREDMQEGTA
jgi:uncharacterized phage infection (PIP) family protein YhgE